jgi:exodeoxyribonuclease VII small subunit
MSETTFKQAWEVLQRNAQTLRNQNEPNIDELLGIVTDSVQAYKVCMSRVEAVDKALEEALKGSGAERQEPAAGARSAAPPADDPDDVPF